MPDRRTRSQLRAEAAHRHVTAIQKENEPWAKDYGRQCLRLPSLILQCGLCQSLAFLEAKGGGDGVRAKAFSRLLADLTQVVYGEKGASPGLAEETRTASSQRYLWLTRETLACSQWFKRYAEAVLRVNRVTRIRSEFDEPHFVSGREST